MIARGKNKPYLPTVAQIYRMAAEIRANRPESDRLRMDKSECPKQPFVKREVELDADTLDYLLSVDD